MRHDPAAVVPALRTPGGQRPIGRHKTDALAEWMSCLAQAAFSLAIDAATYRHTLFLFFQKISAAVAHVGGLGRGAGGGCAGSSGLSASADLCDASWLVCFARVVGACPLYAPALLGSMTEGERREVMQCLLDCYGASRVRGQPAEMLAVGRKRERGEDGCEAGLVDEMKRARCIGRRVGEVGSAQKPERVQASSVAWYCHFGSARVPGVQAEDGGEGERTGLLEGEGGLGGGIVGGVPWLKVVLEALVSRSHSRDAPSGESSEARGAGEYFGVGFWGSGGGFCLRVLEEAWLLASAGYRGQETLQFSADHDLWVVECVHVWSRCVPTQHVCTSIPAGNPSSV